MRNLLKIVLIPVVAGIAAARASTLDMIGVTLLQATTTNLNGEGIRVAQPEAVAPTFEVNPAASGVNQPMSLFTYISTAGTATNFPNSVGNESGHADAVAGIFYGLPDGVATNVIHADNYDADFFSDIVSTNAVNVNDPVVNQSFIFCNLDFSHLSVSDEESANSQFDDYAAHFNTFFISGAGNGGPTNQSQVYPPASCYNGLGVAAFNGHSCTGPTLDNGRCKPDITAPGDETSYSTPLVAGAATILLQAGLRGDGGSDTNSATDLRTLKALLLNGAVKPANWTNATFSPLDMRYGAGVVNVFNAYGQLAGSKNDFNFTTNVPANSPHPPVVMTSAVAVLSGWNFTNITSTATKDAVHHYFFNLTNDSVAPFTATITLVWNRQQGQTDINNLNLFLYNCANSNLVMCSTSLVDNVEHIFLPKLAPGRYDLQVWKPAGIPNISIVSSSETYALAWNFSSQALNAAKSGTNLNLSWPVYPAGFAVAAATNLTSPNWSTNNVPLPVVTNNQNLISMPMTNVVQFFRMQTPNF